MRIVLVTETFLPKVDGVVNTLRHLLEHLALREHPCLLLAPKGGPKRYAGTRVIGLQGVPVPFYPELRLVPPLVDVRKTLARFQPDLVHILNPTSYGVAIISQAHELNLPVVASYHTDVPGFAARWGLGMFKDPLWGYFRWVHNQADLNLAPSEYTRAQLLKHGIQRVNVWGRGVELKRFNPEKRDQTWRERLSGGFPHSPLILFVGRLAPEKRIDWLKPVLESLPAVRLAIVGDGPQRSTLEAAFSDLPVVFTGYLQGDDLARAYASADIFVFPGADETFGNVILEAMASGLPVVAPDTGGGADHVVPGETGLLFPAENRRALVSAVGQLVEKPAAAWRMGRFGRQRAELYRWDHILDALITEYRSLVALWHAEDGPKRQGPQSLPAIGVARP